MKTRQVVLDNFVKISVPLEGVVYTMYRDIRGFVTVGMGNLIEPISLAYGLPWMRDGRRANQSEIIAEWNFINDLPGLDEGGWIAAKNARRPGGLTPLYLTPDAVQALVSMRIQSNEAIFSKRLPAFADWSGDGQLFYHSMAWACGANLYYPRMDKALNAGNFAQAAAMCTINPRKGTILLRNDMNAQLLLNAERVRDKHVDPTVLYYPHIPAPDPGGEFYDHSVASLQLALDLLGYDCGGIDGVSGDKTKAAVMKLQKTFKIGVDGIVGPQTWMTIQNALEHR